MYRRKRFLFHINKTDMHKATASAYMTNITYKDKSSGIHICRMSGTVEEDVVSTSCWRYIANYTYK